VAAVSGIHVEAVSLTTPKTDLGALTRLGTVTPAEDPAVLPAVLGRLAALVIPATVEAVPAPTTVTPTTVPLTMMAPTTVPPTTLPTMAAPTPTSAIRPTSPASHQTSQTGTWIGAGAAFVALFVLVLLVVRVFIYVRRRDRRAAFEASLPQALHLLTSSLRSGHSLLQALDAVAVQADEPARGEFQRVIIRTRLGRDFTEAIRQLAERMQSTELEWVATAIDIHHETGGNLADILDRGGRDQPPLARSVASH
jgi:hypothetical protein